jgi:hypothetical protein
MTPVGVSVTAYPDGHITASCGLARRHLSDGVVAVLESLSYIICIPYKKWLGSWADSFSY